MNCINTFSQLSDKENKNHHPSFTDKNFKGPQAFIDFIYPEVRFPPKELYKVLGEEKIRYMVKHHHDLLAKTKVGRLFPTDKAKFDETVEKAVDFYVQALGGDTVFTDKYGEPHLRSRHFVATIDEKDREIWLQVFKKVLKDIDFPIEYRQPFWDWIEALSIRMINRRTTFEAPKRVPYDKEQ